MIVSTPLFFFNDTATTEIYTLSLHDALPISRALRATPQRRLRPRDASILLDLLLARRRPHAQDWIMAAILEPPPHRSEEHTSELQSRQYLVCRLLLEKKKQPTPIRS